METETQQRRIEIQRKYELIEPYLTRCEVIWARDNLNDGDNGLERVANLVTARALRYGVRLSEVEK